MFPQNKTPHEVSSKLRKVVYIEGCQHSTNGFEGFYVPTYKTPHELKSKLHKVVYIGGIGDCYRLFRGGYSEFTP